MKVIQKKVLLAGIVAIFAFIVTIGSTYAWFTVTSSNTVQEMTMNVQMQDSLLILLEDPTANTNTGYIYDLAHDKAFLDNPANYTTGITAADIAAYYTLSNYVMTPTTTIDGVAFESRSGVPMSGNVFLTLTFWVLSQSQAANVSVSDLVFSANNDTVEKDAVIEAARLSVDGGEDATTIYGWQRDYAYTDAAAPTVMDPGDIATVSALHGTYYDDPVPGAYATDATATLLSATTAFDLAADTPEKITIRVWIEGWDSDCDINLLAAIFDVAFSFRIKE